MTGRKIVPTVLEQAISDLAKALALEEQSYGHYERGRYAFTIEHLFKLSSILGRSVAHFLGIDNGLSRDEDELLTLYKNLPTDRARRLAIRSLRAHADLEREEHES